MSPAPTPPGPPSHGSSTPATRLLEASGVAYAIHEYRVEREEATYGESVATALGIAGSRLFKTLIVQVDDSPVMALVPADRSLSRKRLARVAGGKRAWMAEREDAERLTGYLVGGISPFGGKRVLPVFADVTLRDHETVFVSGGRRGLQVELAPEELIAALGATVVRLADPPPSSERRGS